MSVWSSADIQAIIPYVLYASLLFDKAFSFGSPIILVCNGT